MASDTPISTKSFPKGEAIYLARFEEGMTWNEMRAHFSVSARSSRFLEECVAFVQASEELSVKHPEFAAIDPADRETIKAERARGVGLALLRERTGLKMGELKKIVGEEVGTTSRVAWGARYAGKKAPVADGVEDAVAEAAAILGATGTSAEALLEAASDAVDEMIADGRAPETAEPTDAVDEAPKAKPRRRSRAKVAAAK